MGADSPLLLQPVCPARDDAGIADFLCLATELCPASWAELTLQPLKSDSVSIYHLGNSVGTSTTVNLDVGDELQATLRIGAAEDPSERAIDVLSKSLNTLLERESLRIQSSILSAALDSNWCSVLLFDTSGNILFANPPADRLLSLQTEEHLMAEISGESQQPIFSLLCSLLERVASQQDSVDFWEGAIHTADGRVLSGKVNRLLSPEGDPLAILVLLQPAVAESVSGIDEFAGLHNLSRREAEVVRLLLDGMTTLAMAEQLGISPHTVRDHLKHLYKKTNTNSRSELLGLVSRTSRKTLANNLG